MSENPTPPRTGREHHHEKQTMTEPQEEFVADEARPSKDRAEMEGPDEVAPNTV
jgi:hypothetical protein